MEILNQSTIEEYLTNDSVGKLMDGISRPGDDSLVCQRWMRESAAKRYTFARLYGDLLSESVGRRVLDIGGGLTCFSRILADRHDYRLIDLMAHTDKPTVERLQSECGRQFIETMDWYDFDPAEFGYEIVIANDLFPNVDQRLGQFLDKFLRHSGELRLSLTYYPNPRFYVTRRIDGDEIFCMLAWDGKATARVMQQYLDYIEGPYVDLEMADGESVYPNGRQVCLVRMKERA